VNRLTVSIFKLISHSCISLQGRISLLGGPGLKYVRGSLPLRQVDGGT